MVNKIAKTPIIAIPKEIPKEISINFAKVGLPRYVQEYVPMNKLFSATNLSQFEKVILRKAIKELQSIPISDIEKLKPNESMPTIVVDELPDSGEPVIFNFDFVKKLVDHNSSDGINVYELRNSLKQPPVLLNDDGNKMFNKYYKFATRIFFFCITENEKLEYLKIGYYCSNVLMATGMDRETKNKQTNYLREQTQILKTEYLNINNEKFIIKNPLKHLLNIEFT